MLSYGSIHWRGRGGYQVLVGASCTSSYIVPGFGGRLIWRTSASLSSGKNEGEWGWESLNWGTGLRCSCRKCCCAGLEHWWDWECGDWPCEGWEIDQMHLVGRESRPSGRCGSLDIALEDQEGWRWCDWLHGPNEGSEFRGFRDSGNLKWRPQVQALVWKEYSQEQVF